jgi:hypothetical protein
MKLNLLFSGFPRCIVASLATTTRTGGGELVALRRSPARGVCREKPENPVDPQTPEDPMPLLEEEDPSQTSRTWIAGTRL